MGARPARPRGRAALLVVLVASVVAARIAGEAEPRPVPFGPLTAGDAVAMPPDDVRSSAWYCPAGPAPGERIHVANPGDRDATVAVTALVAGREPQHVQVEVPARSVVTVKDTDITKNAAAGVIVEPFADEIVVEHSAGDSGDVAVGPCSTRPTSHWYFARGTTLRGVQQWLLLFNPFGDDTIVDVTLFTEDGVVRPEALRGLEVPRHTSIAVPIHDSVRRQAEVATVVDARVGRFVAEQSLVFLPDSGRRGVTRSLGAVAPARRWIFADGSPRAGAARSIGIANPGDLDTEVDVQVVTSGDVTVPPVTLPLPSRAAVVVTFGDCGREERDGCVAVPDRVDYGVIVDAAGDVPVVAEELVTLKDTETFTGAVASLGTSRPASRWLFARSSLKDERSAHLLLFNPGADPVTVSVSAAGDGHLEEPAGAQALVVGAGQRLRVGLGDLPNAESAVVVEADGPIVAERTIVRDDAVTRSPGVPDRG